MRNVLFWGLWILALPVALWLGYASARSDDMGILAGLVFLFAVVFSCAQPQRPWRWGLFWGLCIPVSNLLYLALGIKMPYVNRPADVIPSCLALVPAFLGAYAGAGFRHLISVPRPDDPAAPNG